MHFVFRRYNDSTVRQINDIGYMQSDKLIFLRIQIREHAWDYQQLLEKQIRRDLNGN